MTCQPEWQAVLDELRLCIPKPSYDTWLEKTDAGPIEDGVLKVQTPNSFVAEMLERRMYLIISQVVEKVHGQAVDVIFQTNLLHLEPGAVEPRLEDLDESGLMEWLANWGHHQPEWLLMKYGRTLVVSHLVRLFGAYGEKDTTRIGPGLLNQNLSSDYARSQIIVLPRRAG